MLIDLHVFLMRMEKLKLFGPYSPKVDDNDFMILSKEWLEENMSGRVMLADCGYSQTVLQNQNYNQSQKPGQEQDRILKAKIGSKY